MNRWKPLAAGIVAVLALIALFSFAPARALAGELLGLFRVEKFAPISVSPEQLAVLEDVADSGLYPGEFVTLEEPGPSETFTEFEAAKAALADSRMGAWGYHTIASLGPAVAYHIDRGGSAKLSVNLADARAILAAVDIDPQLLPDSLDGADVSVTLHEVLTQEWRDVSLIQTPAPDVYYPADVDPTVIGEAALRFLGMDEGEAYRLAHNIDWTNTLVMPVPTELATFSEVSIGDTTGIAMEAIGGGGGMVMWQQYGMVNMLSADSNWSLADLVTLAAEFSR